MVSVNILFYLAQQKNKFLVVLMLASPISRVVPLGRIHEDVNNFLRTFVYFILPGSGNFFIL